jgi:hypothetical protein
LFGSLLHDLIAIIAGIDAFHCRFQKRLGFRPNQTPLRKVSLHPSFLHDAGALATKPGVSWFSLSNASNCSHIHLKWFQNRINSTFSRANRQY